MSSTTNVQNLLSNVFRPTFTYNTITSNYQTKLELVNIDTVSANTVTAFAASVGDASGNVYVGAGAGNPHTTLVASSNTTDTFLGVDAGKTTANVKNSVFLGYRAGYGVNNSSNSISIGANTLNGGNSNIYIGCGTGIATGSNNIFLGPGVSNGGTTVSNRLLIGSGTNTAIMGDLSDNRIGINTPVLSDPSEHIALDVNGYTRVGGVTNNGGLGINMIPGLYTLDVNGNMRVSDGWGSLIMTHDGESNASLSFSNVRSASCNAVVQAGGFNSLTGTIAIPGNTTSNIGLLKKGVMIVSAQDTTDGTSYAASTILVTVSNTTYTVSSMALTATTAYISNSTSNLTLSNANSSAHTFTYSITYFPLP